MQTKPAPAYAGAKAGLQHLGLSGDQLINPLQGVSDEDRETLRRAMKELDLI